jgi:hypothetical protein
MYSIHLAIGSAVHVDNLMQNPSDCLLTLKG